MIFFLEKRTQLVLFLMVIAKHEHVMALDRAKSQLDTEKFIEGKLVREKDLLLFEEAELEAGIDEVLAENEMLEGKIAELNKINEEIEILKNRVLS